MSMSFPSTECGSCGALATGLVCEHCGAMNASARHDIATENQALDEFHALIGKSEPEQQCELLKSGFLPDQKAVLIEAGVYCIPLLKTYPASEGAMARLEAIISKLKLMPPDQQTSQALAEFQSKIAERKSWERTNDFIFGGGCLLLILTIIIIVLVIYFFPYISALLWSSDVPEAAPIR